MTDEKKQLMKIEIDGTEKEVEIISVLELKEFGKEYVIYKYSDDQGESQKIMVSTLKTENDNYIFDSIATEEEWNRLKVIMKKQAESDEN